MSTKVISLVLMVDSLIPYKYLRKFQENLRWCVPLPGCNSLVLPRIDVKISLFNKYPEIFETCRIKKTTFRADLFKFYKQGNLAKTERLHMLIIIYILNVVLCCWLSKYFLFWRYETLIWHFVYYKKNI